MSGTEVRLQGRTFQETLDHLPKYSFGNGTTIYWDHGFG